MKRFLLAVLALCFLAGCSVNPSKVDDKYAREFINEAVYVKDYRTGICYAIVATRMTAQVFQNGISFTYVPCDQCEKFLVK